MAGRRSGIPLALGIGAAVIVVGGVAFTVWSTNAHRSKIAGENGSAFSISGPPCPPTTEEGLAAQHLEIRYSDEFDGAMFGRRFGNMECAFAKTVKGAKGHAVCQFSSPAGLLITTPKGKFAFSPGIGQPATVEVIGGKAQCVLASNLSNSAR